MARKTRAVIKLSAIQKNLNFLRAQAPQQRQIIVIKADAYGCGMSAVVNALAGSVERYAVGFWDELIPLLNTQDNLSNYEFLILQGPLAQSEVSEVSALEPRLKVQWQVHREDQLQWLLAAGIKSFWIKVDTGMHRLGFCPDSIARLYREYPSLSQSNLVFSTHLFASERPNSGLSQRQLTQLLAVAPDNTTLSVSNSGGVFHDCSPDASFDRIGIALYGISPVPTEYWHPHLVPVMSLEAPIIAIRHIAKGETVGYGGRWQAPVDSTIATVSIGYADGYPRHARDGTPAVCNGQRIKLAGCVSMDMVTFDITDTQGISVGDMVELFGNHLSLNEVASWCDTISYELMTSISPRVTRLWVE